MVAHERLPSHVSHKATSSKNKSFSDLTAFLGLNGSMIFIKIFFRTEMKSRLGALFSFQGRLFTLGYGWKS